MIDSKVVKEKGRKSCLWLSPRPRMGRPRKYSGNLTERRKARRAAAKSKAMAILGGQCARCGNNDTRVLQFDHVYGTENGKRNWRARAKRNKGACWNSTFLRIVAGKIPLDEVQLLCANCHIIKGLESKDHLNHLKPILQMESQQGLFQ